MCTNEHLLSIVCRLIEKSFFFSPCWDFATPRTEETTTVKWEWRQMTEHSPSLTSITRASLVSSLRDCHLLELTVCSMYLSTLTDYSELNSMRRANVVSFSPSLARWSRARWGSGDHRYCRPAKRNKWTDLHLKSERGREKNSDWLESLGRNVYECVCFILAQCLCSILITSHTHTRLEHVHVCSS